MNRGEWDTWKEAYKTWFYNHGQSRAAKPLVSVTAWNVIKVQKKDEIQKVIEEEHGAKPGDREMIAKHQWAVNKEEIKEAERLAEEWRKTKPPAKVQAN
ncbi:hypothetical protein PAXRUDRAFT_18010 [Paxillus rubicundulus Ve08.2h10]|uniref:Uncharacterized protein n=1 Tax=Paxillus rubicundulus Ve08.2h10 TaxID=930991 RepID=A0A0D0CN25_9AGAM|nr:hypothetical protein PAXRUDRAFT_18010 [Paxillus rubicundulus Ve08.2h10]